MSAMSSVSWRTKDEGLVSLAFPLIVTCGSRLLNATRKLDEWSISFDSLAAIGVSRGISNGHPSECFTLTAGETGDELDEDELDGGMGTYGNGDDDDDEEEEEDELNRNDGFFLLLLSLGRLKVPGRSTVCFRPAELGGSRWDRPNRMGAGVPEIGGGLPGFAMGPGVFCGCLE